MKRFLLVLALGGCFGSLDANLHPTVIPKLSALPDEKRGEQLDSANARPDPEQRRHDLSPRARKLELAAAIAAAMIGDALSYSHSVTLGVGTSFDETGALQGGQTTHAPEPVRLVEDPASSELVPWIPVSPAPAKTDDTTPPNH